MQTNQTGEIYNMLNINLVQIVNLLFDDSFFFNSATKHYNTIRITRVTCYVNLK